ncbi:hypothetical protein SeLEV6574_g04117 [Synchytrium endobioticum]|uniref:Uncharacterized protein n=1 Tax=Synchytrium endobioticum TaxID=286115 RepID=A0A507D0R8_9FUNG|nr:hypothetical protein SeLEV6574_g04117 [Synchytrium endobioticum]
MSDQETIKAVQGILTCPYAIEKAYLMPNNWLGRNDTVPRDVAAILVEAEAAGMIIEKDHEEGILRLRLTPTRKEKTYNRVRAVIRRLDEAIEPTVRQVIDIPLDIFTVLSKLTSRWECTCGCGRGLSRTLLTRKVEAVKTDYHVVTKTVHDDGSATDNIRQYILRGLPVDVTLAKNDLVVFLEGLTHCIPLIKEQQIKEKPQTGDKPNCNSHKQSIESRSSCETVRSTSSFALSSQEPQVPTSSSMSSATAINPTRGGSWFSTPSTTPLNDSTNTAGTSHLVPKPSLESGQSRAAVLSTNPLTPQSMHPRETEDIPSSISRGSSESRQSMPIIVNTIPSSKQTSTASRLTTKNSNSSTLKVNESSRESDDINGIPTLNSKSLEPTATCLVFGASMSRLWKEASSSFSDSTDSASWKEKLLSLVETAIHDLDLQMTFDDRGCLLYGVRGSVDEALARYAMLEKSMVDIIQLDLPSKLPKSLVSQLSVACLAKSENLPADQQNVSANAPKTKHSVVSPSDVDDDSEERRTSLTVSIGESNTSDEAGFAAATINSHDKLHSMIRNATAWDDTHDDAMALGNSGTNSDSEEIDVELSPTRSAPFEVHGTDQSRVNGVDHGEGDDTYDDWGEEDEDEEEEIHLDLTTNEVLLSSELNPPASGTDAPSSSAWASMSPPVPISTSDVAQKRVVMAATTISDVAVAGAVDMVAEAQQNSNDVAKEAVGTASNTGHHTPRSLLFDADKKKGAASEPKTPVKLSAVPVTTLTASPKLITQAALAQPSSNVPSVPAVAATTAPPSSITSTIAMTSKVPPQAESTSVPAPPFGVPPYYPYYPSHPMYSYGYPPYASAPAAPTAVAVPGTPMMHPIHYPPQGFPLPSPALRPSGYSSISNSVPGGTAVPNTTPTTHVMPAMMHPYGYQSWAWPPYPGMPPPNMPPLPIAPPSTAGTINSAAPPISALPPMTPFMGPMGMAPQLPPHMIHAALYGHQMQYQMAVGAQAAAAASAPSSSATLHQTDWSSQKASASGDTTQS